MNLIDLTRQDFQIAFKDCLLEEIVSSEFINEVVNEKVKLRINNFYLNGLFIEIADNKLKVDFTGVVITKREYIRTYLETYLFEFILDSINSENVYFNDSTIHIYYKNSFPSSSKYFERRMWTIELLKKVKDLLEQIS